MSTDATFCVILPAYQEEGRIGPVVKSIRAYAEHVIVVDDGCTDATAAEARAAGAHVIQHGVNRGKGAALQTGFSYARQQSLDFVITLDSDGQHDPAHIPDFVARYRSGGCPVIVGSRMADTRNMPLVRKLTNRFMSWLLSRMMGQRVRDTQSGYRLYRTDILPLIRSDAGGFAAESEVLLNLSAAGIRIDEVPIRVIYGDETSKIRPVRDAVRFFQMIRRFRKRSQDLARGE